jgi:hypothetical protein
VRDDGGVRVLDCRWSRSSPAIEDGGFDWRWVERNSVMGTSPQGQVIGGPWVGLEEEERVTNSEATCHEEDERY